MKPGIGMILLWSLLAWIVGIACAAVAFAVFEYVSPEDGSGPRELTAYLGLFILSFPVGLLLSLPAVIILVLAMLLGQALWLPRPWIIPPVAILVMLGCLVAFNPEPGFFMPVAFVGSALGGIVFVLCFQAWKARSREA